ncbi:MAG: response regulator [Candidatus Omnitrophica bacterium]|nr:response regulator [Candidatus Omnitrophota bacterium]
MFLKNLFAPPKKFNNHKVLIVDDNPLDRKLVAKTMEKMGCKVLTAVDGEIGLHLALAEKPDLILSDYDMPHMDGLTMCKELRANQETQDIPVIFLSGSATPGNIVDIFDVSNVDNYICKPINSKVLIHQIEDIFNKHLPKK